MKNFELKDLCSGGCTAKLGPDFLANVLNKIPKNNYDENLIIGYDSSDDAAVYKLTDNLAIVQTLDFFTPIVEDPYIFGKIAAANSLSDIYAMGGEVKIALNIVCFPEKMNPDVLAEILRGGAEKVHEAGGILSGGHSINDKDIKYGMSVTGIINPNKVLANNKCKVGDKLILTKPLGVGIVSTAYKVGEGSKEAYIEAINSMEYLNKYAAEKMTKYNINACTDITGFGFLGHLIEMIGNQFTAEIFSNSVPYIKEAYDYAKEFLLTSAAQRNRNYLSGKILFDNIDFPTQEILFDPQTSGGLLISLPPHEADKLINDLEDIKTKSAIVGEIVEKKEYSIIVK